MQFLWFVLMTSGGLDMIDLGAQSTRPMASRISPQEELDRLIPLLQAVVKMPELDGKLVSVDTFYSEVVSKLANVGAYIINDVYGGQLDHKMTKVVAGLGVPYVVMPMRGDPATMQNNENLQYENVCKQVASELHMRITDAKVSGIPAWRIIVDPGLGFSKHTSHNLEILVRLPTIRVELAWMSLAASHAPVSVGPSRKKFLGEICCRAIAIDRDAGTVASVTAGVLGGANIVRLHNVRDNLDAANLCDAMMKYKRTCA